MRTGVSSNLTEGAPTMTGDPHADVVGLGGAGLASEPRLEIVGAATRRGFKSLSLRHPRIAQRNERSVHTGEVPWFDPRCGDCGRSSTVERRVVAPKVAVQLRSIAPRERRRQGESGLPVKQAHRLSGFESHLPHAHLAFVAKGTERRMPSPEAGGSIPLGGAHDGLGRSRVGPPACKAGYLTRSGSSPALASIRVIHAVDQCHCLSDAG